SARVTLLAYHAACSLRSLSSWDRGEVPDVLFRPGTDHWVRVQETCGRAGGGSDHSRQRPIPLPAASLGRLTRTPLAVFPVPPGGAACRPAPRAELHQHLVALLGRQTA